MLLLALYYGDIVQLAFAVVSAVLVVVSALAYRRRSETRYLLLTVAFASLFAVAADTALLELAVAAGPVTSQLVELYVNPSLEILMGVSFLLAIVWTRRPGRRVVLAAAAAVVAFALLAVASAGTNAIGQAAGAPAVLPAGCVKPPGGFLIIATSEGYNDSIGHGVPSQNWPVLDVAEGANVDITVCNAYALPVGFQVSHYLDSRTESVSPGEVMNVDFLANVTGTFPIYCSVVNPIHIFLQSGELDVS